MQAAIHFELRLCSSKKAFRRAKTILWNDISLFELGKAIEKAKKGTSPGCNEWSFNVLNRHWAIFWIPTNTYLMVSQKKSTYKDKECSSASRPDWLEKFVFFHRVNVYICYAQKPKHSCFSRLVISVAKTRHKQRGKLWNSYQLIR